MNLLNLLIALASLVLFAQGVPTVEDNNVHKKSYAGYKLLRTEPILKPHLAKALLLSFDGKHGKQLFHTTLKGLNYITC